MIRRPPRSTLFPYTTLFRSLLHQKEGLKVGGTRVDLNLFVEEMGKTVITIVESSPPDICSRVGGRDRKSTRLNSSHTVISYAVFCLKKKKKNKQRKKQVLKP